MTPGSRIIILLLVVLGLHATRAWAENRDLKILSVSQNATADEVQKAYQKLIKAYHPDHSPDDPDAEKKLKEITAAYVRLGKPKKDNKKWKAPKSPMSLEDFRNEVGRDYSNWKPDKNSTSAYDAAFEFAIRSRDDQGLGYDERAAHVFSREMSEKYSRRVVLAFIDEYKRVMNLAPNDPSAMNYAKMKAYEKSEKEAEIEVDELIRAETESAKARRRGQFLDKQCFMDRLKSFFGI